MRAKRRLNSLADELDAAKQFFARKFSVVHLKGHAIDAAKGRSVTQNLFTDFVGVTDEQSARRAILGIKALARHGRPTAFAANAGKRLGVAGEVVVNGLFAARSHVAQRMQPHLELFGGVPRLGSCGPLEVDSAAKAVGFAPDHGYHQRKSE